jgi:arginase
LSVTSGVCLIRAPSNLGLRPPAPDRQPGTWRAPQALTAAGLIKAVRPVTVLDLDRPVYDPRPQPGTRLYNGHRVRAFNLALADFVERASARDQFPLVIGGDCSILLGALAGVRRAGPVSLVHLDGHSDFRHPGNYDAATVLGAVAGMDLALATGRGEALLTDWPGVTSPLVPDGQVVQIGEREGRDPDFAWPDINETAITRIDVFAARRLGPQAVLDRANAVLDQEPGSPFWVHFDVDVLDRTVMPAVDTPGSPGIDPEDATAILRSLTAAPPCCGMTVTIFDPDLDPTGGLALLLMQLLKSVLDGRAGAA